MPPLKSSKHPLSGSRLSVPRWTTDLSSPSGCLEDLSRGTDALFGRLRVVIKNRGISREMRQFLIWFFSAARQGWTNAVAVERSPAKAYSLINNPQALESGELIAALVIAPFV